MLGSSHCTCLICKTFGDLAHLYGRIVFDFLVTPENAIFNIRLQSLLAIQSCYNSQEKSSGMSESIAKGNFFSVRVFRIVVGSE